MSNNRKIMFLALLAMVSYTIGMEQPLVDGQKKRLEAIQAKYKVPRRCPKNRAAGDLNTDVACLISGYKKVVKAEGDAFAKLDPQLKLLFESQHISYLSIHYQIFVDKKLIPQSRIFFYNPQGERSALLLAKLRLEYSLDHILHRGIKQPQNKNEKPKPITENRHLAGMLLGFSSQDKASRLQTKDFYDYYGYALGIDKAELENKILKPNDFNTWPEDARMAFTKYVNQVWPTSKVYKEFQEEEDAAQKWIKKHSAIKNEQLREQIKTLERVTEKIVQPARDRVRPTQDEEEAKEAR